MRLAKLAFIGGLSLVALVAQGCGGDDEAPATALPNGGTAGTAGTANAGDSNGGDGNAGDSNGGDGNAGDSNGGMGNGGDGPGDAGSIGGSPGDGGDGDGDGGGLLDGSLLTDGSVGVDAGNADAGDAGQCPGAEPDTTDACTVDAVGTRCDYGGGTECVCANVFGPFYYWRCGVCPATDPSTADAGSCPPGFVCEYGATTCTCGTFSSEWTCN